MLQNGQMHCVLSRRIRYQDTGKEKKMDIEAKIKLLEDRLNKLTGREKDNQEVCRRIRRDIRNLRKKQEKITASQA